MIYALLVLHGFVTLAMIGIILLQKSDDSGPLGIGGGGNNALFTARGVANILTRSTAVLGALFIGNCILIDRLTSRDLNKSQTLFAQTSERKSESAEPSERKDSQSDATEAAEASSEDVPAEAKEKEAASEVSTD